MICFCPKSRALRACCFTRVAGPKANSKQHWRDVGSTRNEVEAHRERRLFVGKVSGRFHDADDAVSIICPGSWKRVASQPQRGVQKVAGGERFLRTPG